MVNKDGVLKGKSMLEKEMYTGSGRATCWKRTVFEKKNVGGDIIKIGDVYWFHLAQDANIWMVNKDGVLKEKSMIEKEMYTGSGRAT